MLSISKSQVEYVLALYRTGSFSEAAELCFVTQSTLSTMVKKIETQIGFQLFSRKEKPIKLTAEGELLIKQFRDMLHQYEILEEKVQEAKDKMNGTLSIGIIPTLAPFLLPLFLNKVVSKYQGIKFFIYEITTNEIVQRLKAKDIDIGLMSIPISEKGLVQKKLFTEEFLVYDTSFKINSKKKYQIKDIDLSRLWLLEEGHCMTHQIGQICHLKKKRLISSNLVYNSGSIISLLEFVNINKGLTLLPKLAIGYKNLIDVKYLHKMANPVPAREIGFVTHSDFVKNRIYKVLESEIKDAVKPILKKTENVRVIKPD